jgi:hypothetical protein
MAAPVFAVFFAERSPAIPDSAFSRVDATHWVLDVPPAAAAARDIGLTLLAPNALAPDAALGLYVSVGGKDWAWRGYVSNDRPSEIAPTAWPAADGAPGAAAGARVGVSLEPRAEAEAKESSRATSRLDFARAVGQVGASSRLIEPSKLENTIPKNGINKQNTIPNQPPTAHRSRPVQNRTFITSWRATAARASRATRSSCLRVCSTAGLHA